MQDFQEIPAYCQPRKNDFEVCFFHTEGMENFLSNCTALRDVKLLNKYLSGNLVFISVLKVRHNLSDT